MCCPKILIKSPHQSDKTRTKLHVKQQHKSTRLINQSVPGNIYQYVCGRVSEHFARNRPDEYEPKMM